MTRRSFRTPLLAAALAALMAFSVGGCGRRGPLEAPPDPLVEAAKAKDPNGKPKRRSRTPLKIPDSFVLDPLV